MIDLPVLARGDLRDEQVAWPVRSRKTLADAYVFSFVTDAIQTPTGEELHRSYLQHPGAVVVLPVDDDDHVIVVRQQRHPVGMRCVEAPAGLLDVAGEDPWRAAQRELAEEVQLAAEHWHVLVDCFPSPGSMQESTRIFLARGLTPVPAPEGFQADGEEADMDVAKVALDDLISACASGELHNSALMLGALAFTVARARDGLDDLRPADAPWPARAAKEAVDHAVD